MRLVRGTPHAGIVQLCHNQDWGTVCAEGWNDVDASVVCRQLGFSPRGTLGVLLTVSIPDLFSTDAIGHSTFVGYYTPIFLNEVSCSGSEELLLDCSHSGIGFYVCSVGEAVAICSGEKHPNASDL